MISLVNGNLSMEGDFAATVNFLVKKITVACEEVYLVGNSVFIFVNKGKPDGPSKLLIG